MPIEFTCPSCQQELLCDESTAGGKGECPGCGVEVTVPQAATSGKGHVTQHEIVALKCPSCGGGSTQPSRELTFGAEFRCNHCGTTSVLIVGRELIPLGTLQKQGETVCSVCGRVAQHDARFCQEGHPLVRKCIKCLKEFAVDHQRCDACGWPQGVNPDTVEGMAVAFDRAVSDLEDPDKNVVEAALRVIARTGGTASDAARAAAVSAIIKVAMNSPYIWWRTNVDGIEALRKLRPTAQQAVPMLRQRIEETWSEGWGAYDNGRYRLLQCLGAIAPEDALPYCSRGLEEAGKNGEDKDINCAASIAQLIGKISIPVLEKFTGLFSGRRGLKCRETLQRLR